MIQQLFTYWAYLSTLNVSSDRHQRSGGWLLLLRDLWTIEELACSKTSHRNNEHALTTSRFTSNNLAGVWSSRALYFPLFHEPEHLQSQTPTTDRLWNCLLGVKRIRLLHVVHWWDRNYKLQEEEGQRKDIFVVTYCLRLLFNSLLSSLMLVVNFFCVNKCSTELVQVKIESLELVSWLGDPCHIMQQHLW